MQKLNTLLKYTFLFKIRQYAEYKVFGNFMFLKGETVAGNARTSPSNRTRTIEQGHK